MQRTAIILACFCFCTTSLAQHSPFIHYTPKDGLVNSRVRKAYQDSKGRMYFLTYGGLSVFDGARFRNYTMSNGLASTLVNDVFEIGDDSLLIASNSGHFVNLLARGEMKKWNNEPGCPVVNQFYRHTNGKIYLSADQGLFQFEGNNFRELNIYPLKEKTLVPYLETLSGYGNWLLFSVSETRHLRGLYLYDITRDQLSDSLAISSTLFPKDNEGRSWISANNQMFLLDTIALDKGKIKLIPPKDDFKELKDHSISNMTFRDKLTWLIFRDMQFRSIEIRAYDKNGVKYQLPLPPEISSSVIRHIYVDRENSVWLSNDGEGVFKLVRSPLQQLVLPDHPGKEILVHLAFSNGTLSWLSSNTNIFYRSTSDRIETFHANLEKLQVFHDKGNTILAKDMNTIYEGKISGNTILFRPIISINNDFIGRNVFLDKYDNLIGILESGLGVWKKGKMIFHVPKRAPNDMSNQLAFDDSGRLWSVNRYTGIDVYSLNPENEQQYLKPEKYYSQKLITGSPRAFVIDRSGLIWIGTRSDGLAAYRQEGDQLVRKFFFDTGNGLTDNFVNVLACDSLNNIIVGTQTGIDRIVYINGTYRVENLSRGRNHFAFTRDVWAMGNYGYSLSLSGQVFQITPTSDPQKQSSPPLLLEELKVNSKSILPEENEFRYTENNISFLLAAPSFIDEKQINYSYKLEGSGNEQWSDTSSLNSTINFANLSPGEYRLRARAFFPSSVYPPVELTYSFAIIPPWWQTWWFRAGVGLLIIGLLIIGIRFYYNRKLERQKLILEKQQAIEKERTRIATDMHDDLGAGLSRIKFLSETIGIKQQQNQAVEEEISSIRNYSHEMIDKMGEIVWALNQKNDTLSDLLAYTRSYAVDYLNQNGIYCIIETPELFPQMFVSGEFRRNIYLTIKEALHNIVKHANAGQVKISINIDDKLMINIKDDGVGFNTKEPRPFSNGLTNMKKRIRDIGGQLEIKNSGGTSIHLEAPLS